MIPIIKAYIIRDKKEMRAYNAFLLSKGKINLYKLLVKPFVKEFRLLQWKVPYE